MSNASRLRTCVLGRVASVALAAAAPAWAYSANVSWSAPEPCPDVAALRHSVERLLGEPPTEGAAVQASADVTAEADGRFTLALTLRTEEGERTRRLRTDSCQSALEVAAFAVALALKPDLDAAPPSVVTWPSEPEPPEPSPPPRVDPKPDSPPALVPPVAQRPAPVSPGVERPHPAAVPAPARVELWGGAKAVADSSLLPDPALGAGVSVDVRVTEWLRLGAEPLLFLPQNERLEAGSGGLFSLWSIQAYACGLLGAGIDLCPLFRYGVMKGRGRGVSPPLDQTSLLYAPGAAVVGSYALSPRALARAGLTALFPLNRDAFVVRDGRVHRTPPASLELSLGIAARVF